ncbi:Abcc1, partial [Symbiodinium microadriaticum]
ITLSGGQKARVNIARALYAANKDLYLLDDPLAAVDVHVGKKIFENAFLKLLQGKARVLVLSSNYHLLPHCDKILVVNGGDVDKLQQDKRDADITFAASDDEEAGEESSSDSEDKGDKSTGDSITGLIGVAAAAPARRSKLKKSHSMYHSHRSMITEKQKSGKVLTTEEDRLKGGVALSSYWQYFASSVDPDHIWDGYVTVTVVIVLFTIGQTTRVFSDMWVGIWASSNDRAESDHSNRFYLTWYVILVGVSALFVFGRAQYF